MYHISLPRPREFLNASGKTFSLPKSMSTSLCVNHVGMSSFSPIVSGFRGTLQTVRSFSSTPTNSTSIFNSAKATTKNIGSPLHLELANKSINILQALRNYPPDWVGVHKEMDAEQRKVVSPKKLEWEWKDRAGLIRAFENIGESELSEDEDGDHLLTVKCKIANGPVDVLLSFDSETKGLTGLETFLGAPDITNDYCDTTLFTEKDIVINEGKELPLKGKITFPKTAEVKGSNGVPALVLVPTTGSRDMDMTFEANKPFRDIAAALAARGVAVIRYNSRTFQHEEKLTESGFFKDFTAKEEIIDDAVAAIDLAKSYPGVDPSKIFVAGFSMGAVVTPRIVKERPDVAGVMMINPIAESYENSLQWQQEYIKSVEDENDEREAGKEKERRDDIMEEFNNEITKISELEPGTASTDIILGVPAKYWDYLHSVQQIDESKEMSTPAFFMFGGRDNLATKEDIDLWEDALYSRPKTVMKMYPDLHQLLIHSSSELEIMHPSEFEVPGLVDPEVIEDMSNFISDPNWKGTPEQNDEDAETKSDETLAAMQSFKV
eukprot:TRINITY_DN2874_c0_g1_i1.p1 TRINITY_DN2874_c0_g1~~TRINITY_DN2874_c0_g1_i1.p1  ORF type:complete len:577 (+),score=143.04 TRINITY_DN2874_c0_g1_i1:84-1733(+)